MNPALRPAKSHASPQVHASGDQIELVCDRMRLTAVTVGGGIRELVRDDWRVLDGYGADEVAFGAYGQALIPWPNRIADGRYEFQGQTYQLALTEPDKHNSIHGFARWMTWKVERHDASTALLSLVIYPRAGYPFALHLGVEYTLSPSGVTVTTTARNVGRSPLPYANGFHPYISVGSPRIDSCLLKVPAVTWLPSDERGIPMGKQPVEGSAYDFRAPRAIGPMRLDTGYGDLIRDSEGLARVELTAADDSRSVGLWMDSSYSYVMTFTGDTLDDASRRRRSLGVEPMTAAPNAFQSGDGLRVLEPGEATTSVWGIDIR